MNYLNFKHTSVILIIAIFLLPFFTACEDGDDDNALSNSIEGEWKRKKNPELVISIESSEAEFVSFGDAELNTENELESFCDEGWNIVNEQGFVNSGDKYLKEIEPAENQGPLVWSCRVLWFKYEGNNITDVYWSDISYITLNEDGTKLNIESNASYEDQNYADDAVYFKTSE